VVAPAQVIQALRPFRWRGLGILIESAPVDFSHSLAERRYPYIDGAGHDWTGRDPIKCRVRMYFFDAGIPGDLNAFTKKWPLWRKALFDGTSGALDHPILGRFQARVESGSIQYVATTTAGVIVDASFTETVDNIDKPTQVQDPQPSGVEVAVAAQVAASTVGINWPSQKLDLSLGDAFKALQTAFWDAQVTFAGYANQIIGSIEEMIVQAESLTDPTSYPAYDNLVHAWFLAKDAVDKAQKDLRATGSRIVQADTTLSTFAAEVGNTEAEVMQLNYALLKSPIVPKGTAVNYYTGK